MNTKPEDSEAVVPLNWIKLDQYCKITGDTPGAVHTRRRKRQWQNGVQCIVAPDGNIWVNPAEVNRWVTSGAKAPA